MHHGQDKDVWLAVSRISLKVITVQVSTSVYLNPPPSFNLSTNL